MSLKKKSKEVKSVELGGHSITPLRPIYPEMARLTTVERDENNEVEQCAAGSVTDHPAAENSHTHVNLRPYYLYKKPQGLLNEMGGNGRRIPKRS